MKTENVDNAEEQQRIRGNTVAYGIKIQVCVLFLTIMCLSFVAKYDYDSIMDPKCTHTHRCPVQACCGFMQHNFKYCILAVMPTFGKP